MSRTRRAERRAARAARRRRALTALLLIAVAATAMGLWSGSRDGAGTESADVPAMVIVTREGRPVLRAEANVVAGWPATRLERWLRRVPGQRDVRRGPTLLEKRTDRAALRSAVRRAARAGGGRVAVPERTVRSQVRVRVVKQVLRNNCETATLAMLLAARGIRARQLDLQRALARSGPLDPRRDAGTPVWGDPERGFVGRPDGGGTDGGYGVYEPPVIQLARTRGARLSRLSGDRDRIYRTLLAGRPVMTWIGLSDGPFMTWQTPEGRKVRGNFGEHTVLLTGIDGDSLTVNDPLSGKRLTWSRSYFEQLWERLGRRAIA